MTALGKSERVFTGKGRVNRTGSVEVLHWDGGHTATQDTNSLVKWIFKFPTMASGSDGTGWENSTKLITHFEKLMTVILTVRGHSHEK